MRPPGLRPSAPGALPRNLGRHPSAPTASPRSAAAPTVRSGVSSRFPAAIWNTRRKAEISKQNKVIRSFAGVLFKLPFTKPAPALMEPEVPQARCFPSTGVWSETMLPWTVTEKVLRDAQEMRAFYASFDLAPETTERALAVSFPTLSAKQVDARPPVRAPR